MKKYLGLLGILLLLVSSILPIALLNKDWITLIPIFDNFDLQGGIWEWRDISAFAATYPIILIIILFFLMKKNLKVALPLIGVLFFILFFVLVSLFMTSTKVENFHGVDFSFSFGWIIILIGLILLIYSSVTNLKNKDVS